MDAAAGVRGDLEAALPEIDDEPALAGPGEDGPTPALGGGARVLGELRRQARAGPGDLARRAPREHDPPDVAAGIGVARPRLARRPAVAERLGDAPEDGAEAGPAIEAVERHAVEHEVPHLDGHDAGIAVAREHVTPASATSGPFVSSTGGHAGHGPRARCS